MNEKMKLTILNELVERKPRNERASTKDVGSMVGRSSGTARKYLVEMRREGLVDNPYYDAEWEITDAGQEVVAPWGRG